MQIAERNIGVGDRRKYVIDYRDFLEPGYTLTGATVTVAAQTPPATSTIDTVSVDNGIKVYFFVNAGVLNEVFTANVVATDNLSETVNDTIQFTVIAP